MVLKIRKLEPLQFPEVAELVALVGVPRRTFMVVESDARTDVIEVVGSDGRYRFLCIEDIRGVVECR